MCVLGVCTCCVCARVVCVRVLCGVCACVSLCVLAGTHDHIFLLTGKAIYPGSQRNNICALRRN